MYLRLALSRATNSIMKTFCCFVSGEDFPGELSGKEVPVGFFVSVFVNASDPIEAKAKSLEMLMSHPELALSGGAELPKSATTSFKVVHELEHRVNPKVTEFQFFEMDE